ncbi:MAG TPA: bifunctional folylpolyglutamate synthase/dihydrofolate synthase, partial [Ferruginibacter sp.]|nr:bifunctional folylpolyglutamate synthase/dihydrofolate synthase [Ferruginibacter sp.]
KTGYVIEDTIVSESLRQIKKITGLRGRWDLLQTRPDVIIDVGHNEDGIKNIVAQLGSQYPNARQHFVIGFAKDKDLNRLLDLFPKNALYYFTNAHLPRALPHTALKKLAAEKHVHGNSYDHVDEAINHALANANESDVVMVCGSFFVIAETTCFKNS